MYTKIIPHFACEIDLRAIHKVERLGYAFWGEKITELLASSNIPFIVCYGIPAEPYIYRAVFEFEEDAEELERVIQSSFELAKEAFGGKEK